MQDFPHHYHAVASAAPKGDVELSSPGLETLKTAGPAEFGGPGDKWSPETLLVGSVADCFILSFRAVARASRVDWLDLQCEVVGNLDRVDKITRFTEFRINAVLAVPEGVAEAKAVRALEKAKKHCLITNSLSASTTLETEVRVLPAGQAAGD